MSIVGPRPQLVRDIIRVIKYVLIVFLRGTEDYMH